MKSIFIQHIKLSRNDSKIISTMEIMTQVLKLSCYEGKIVKLSGVEL